MNPGIALGGIVLAAVLIVRAPAQNLGLGTGARSSLAADSTMQASPRANTGVRKDSGAPPRKDQINRRLGLSARNYRKFDPRDFEARGRELQGRFYEIGDPPPGLKSASGSRNSLIAQVKTGHSRQWMIWVGLAGVAGASAGALGYYMMTQAHPSSAPPPQILNLSDDPLQP